MTVKPSWHAQNQTIKNIKKGQTHTHTQNNEDVSPWKKKIFLNKKKNK